jgi:signal transduction histidine kinase/CheY-like chemotaxis protein
LSIRTRLFLLVLAVWLPAAVAFGLLAWTTYERETSAAKETMNQQALALSQLVERELDKRGEIARTLGATAALRDGDLALFHQIATTATHGTSNWVMLLDATRQLANTQLPFNGARALPRPDNAPLVASEPEAFFYKTVPIQQKPVVAVLAPELAISPTRYNVAVSFSPAVIQKLLEDQQYFEMGTAAILDREHRIVARNRDPAKWLGAPATGDLRHRIESGEVGFGESVTLDGIPSLTYLTRPNHYGWSTVIAIPQAVLLASARKATFHALVAAGILLMIGLVIALYAGRRISRPILALQESAAALGRDKIPAKLITGVSEADVVSEALHEAGVRSQDATRKLEERVAQAVEQAQQAQAKLLDAQKHEAIGRLTGGLAHDFNNLLQTISTALQVVDSAVKDERQRRVMTAAQRACSKAASLVRQMLTFGRAEPLEPHAIDLNDFLLNTRELTGKAVGHHIQLSASIASGTPALYVDPTQLELALLNLVFNARDAMPDGGHIRITARPAETSESSALGREPFVWLEVADDGSGMDERTVAKAFEPYFTTKRIGAGTGLGLAQVKAFARQSGGDVVLDSGLGRGTRVVMLLPVCKPSLALASIEPVARLGGEFEPLHVLMVEDDALVASVVAPALEAAGHTVRLCATADEALVLLEAGWTGDVLFTDVVMPGVLSGMDLVAWCRTHRPRLHTVVATGYTTQHAEPGITVLRKPYEIDDLFMALHESCQRSGA